MGQSIIMPQTLRLAGSRAVAHVTSRDTPRPPLFRHDDGWPRLRAIPGPVVGHEEVGVAGAKMGCRIARSDPKILYPLTLKSCIPSPSDGCCFQSLSRGESCPNGDDRPTDGNSLTGDDSQTGGNTGGQDQAGDNSKTRGNNRTGEKGKTREEDCDPKTFLDRCAMTRDEADQPTLAR